LRHSDGRVRIWHKQNENMDPSCLVTTVQAGGGVMVWGMFSRHTLGLLLRPTWALFLTMSIPLWPQWVHCTKMAPQSPDLNPIEHLWDVGEWELRALDVHPTNLHQLQDAILSIWVIKNAFSTLLNQC